MYISVPVSSEEPAVCEHVWARAREPVALPTLQVMIASPWIGDIDPAPSIADLKVNLMSGIAPFM